MSSKLSSLQNPTKHDHTLPRSVITSTERKTRSGCPLSLRLRRLTPKRKQHARLVPFRRCSRLYLNIHQAINSHRRRSKQR